MSVKTDFSYLNWTPKEHNFIKDDVLRDVVHNKGYFIKDCLSTEVLEGLNNIYLKEHSFNVDSGGMFYSMYSKDKEYRKRVHEKIGALLKPTLDSFFGDYNNVINAFVIKLPGDKSEFYVHQDTTALDEFKFSPLSLWIPLEDITSDNGALAVIEKTHWFFSPYRSISMPFPFRSINDTIRKYLKPLFMKKGEVLFFDNRIIHNSLINKSTEARVAVICGIFPKEASFLTCYKDSEKGDSSIELIKHEENFLLDYDHFFYDCTTRPTSGKVIGTVKEQFPDMTSEVFEGLCKVNNIQPVKQLESLEMTTVNCDLIAEPDGINKFEATKETVNKQPFLKAIFKKLRV